MKKTPSIRPVALLCGFALLLSGLSACSKKGTPAPPTAPIDARLLLGAVWNTVSVAATKPDGTTVTITGNFTALFLAQPRFDTLPSGSAAGTGNEKLFGENFDWNYDATSHVLTVPLSMTEVETPTIASLDAHRLVLHYEGTTIDYGSAYAKFDQTLTR
jgi:hypothetical protein